MSKKTFTINVTMEERWINTFMSMLMAMQTLGEIGSSRVVSIMSDGDGDFRPKFETEVEFIEVEPVRDLHYDAG